MDRGDGGGGGGGGENINSKRHTNKIECVIKTKKGKLGGSGGTRIEIKTDIVTKFLVIYVNNFGGMREHDGEREKERENATDFDKSME